MVAVKVILIILDTRREYIFNIQIRITLSLLIPRALINGSAEICSGSVCVIFSNKNKFTVPLLTVDLISN